MDRWSRFWSLAVLLLVAACDAGARSDLERELVGRGRVALLGGEDLGSLRARDLELVPVSKLPGLEAALRARDPAGLSHALLEAQVQGLLVDARPGAVPPVYPAGAQLSQYARVDGLQGAYLSPMAVLYVLDPLRSWSPSLRAGLANVARRLIGGAAPPHLRSFPEVARKMEPAEVMVLLRSGSKARLWRSARGSSFARAMLTATEVARQRWNEREQAMGGPLDRMLPRMQVELSLLQDDGEIGSPDESFVNRVVLPVHGVAYEHQGAWRYWLPEATHAAGIASPSRAYARLFAEDGLPEDSLRSQTLRPYRLAVQLIGISAAPAPTAVQLKDGLSEVGSPDEVLAR